MALFKIFKGLKNNLPKTYKDGYCYFTTDDGKMYIDTKDNNSAGRIVLNAEKADKLSSSRKITLSGNLQGSFNFDGSSDVTTSVTVIGAKMTDHLWLTGANANSSTANSSQIIFGTEENNHVAISSNNNALVINPTASSTTNQIVLYLDSPSVFPSGIKGNLTGNASTASKLGTSTVGAAADRPIYLNAGTATATTYRMAATNTTATTALSIANDLPTGIWYVNGTGGVSDFNQSDGVCIANQYSDKWITEIYQDYRTGQLAIRGKNNGTWQAWRKVLDSTNYTNYAPTKTGVGASGTWGISITGNAATATKATQDGSGNVITSKYVTLDTNQTISGIKTMSAALNLANGTWNKAGDDAYFGDNNTAGSFAIKGINGATNIKMVAYGDAADTNYGSITWSGNNFIFDKKIQVGNSTQNGMTQAVGIHVHDLRNATITPNSFGDQSVNFIFDNRLGTGDWRSAIQVKGWTGNYAAWQLSGGAGTAASNKLYYREGTGSTWSSWYTIPFENRVNTFTELNTFSTGNNKGIKIGAAYITAESAQNGEIVLQNGHLRFGPSDWNYNVWGGLACNGSGTIALGLADNVYFKANTVQTGGTLTLPGIHYLVISNKEAIAAYDSWLRINEDLAFSSGIYFGTSLVRTDGQFQVGSGGSAFYANNSGNVYASNAIGAGGRIYTGYDSGVTGAISCSNWFRTNGETGLYNATYSLHLMPNTISNYAGWRVSGKRGDYHGILIGDATTSMAIMSVDNSHQGLYTQSGTGWIIYNNNANTNVGIRTSNLVSGYNITMGGSTYVNGAAYINGATSINGSLSMNNKDITGVNYLEFADPGVGEGITWTGGNDWNIYESPDNLTNGAGNLQFVHGSTRRLTIRTDGVIYVNGTLEVSGQIRTSFKSSIAMGSYQAAATTIPDLVEEIRYSSGATGSVNITTAYATVNSNSTVSGGTIETGWYNFFYSPHRSGGNSGAASGDNHNYGTLILNGMNNNNRTWIITISSGSILISRRMWCSGDSVKGAVWNDYAECRESNCEDFGYVLMEVGDDSLIKTTERLSHFAGISSDTYGFSQGETDKAKTPIAVAGRVLAYPYQNRDNYKPGDCVCAAPGGTVDIMTREEIINWPDRIVGTVSCVPDYEEWGGGESADRPAVKVNGRIWIKVK